MQRLACRILTSTLIAAAFFLIAATVAIPLTAALTAQAERLFPTEVRSPVRVNQVFVYRLPEDARPLLPFGLLCSPSSPSILQDGEPLLAATAHYGSLVAVFPDPINGITLASRHAVSVLIPGKCYFLLPAALGEVSLFRYTICLDRFAVGEVAYSQEELTRLVGTYIEGPLLPPGIPQLPPP